MSIYAASKSFVTSFSSSLHEELKEQGVDILVSCPGMVTTNFAKRAAGKEVNVSGPVMSAAFAARRSGGRLKKEKRNIFLTGVTDGEHLLLNSSFPLVV